MALKNKTEVLQSYCKVVPSLTVVFRFFMIVFFFYFILTQAYTIALAVTAGMYCLNPGEQWWSALL